MAAEKSHFPPMKPRELQSGFVSLDQSWLGMNLKRRKGVNEDGEESQKKKKGKISHGGDERITE